MCLHCVITFEILAELVCQTSCLKKKKTVIDVEFYGVQN